MNSFQSYSRLSLLLEDSSVSFLLTLCHRFEHFFFASSLIPYRLLILCLLCPISISFKLLSSLSEGTSEIYNNFVLQVKEGLSSA